MKTTIKSALPPFRLYHTLLICSIFVFGWTASCRDKETKPEIKPPVLGPTTISEVKTASAKASSSLKEVGFGASTTSTISDFGFCYGPKENPTTSDTKLQSGTTASQPQDFSGNLTGLTGGTNYFVRAYVVHEGGTVYSDQASFKTENLKAPDVVTLDVSDINTAAFSIAGRVNGAGTSEVTQYGHVLSETSQTPSTADTKTEYGGTGAPKDFKSTFNNLKINTTYYARAYATSAVGTSYGELRTVKTQNAVAPTVTTGDISNVSGNAATVGMNIVTVGTNSNLQAGVCWSSTNQTPTVGDSKTTAGASAPQFFSNSLTNLTPGTTYYVRAYATSSVGTGYGEVKSFKTSNPVAPVLGNITFTTTGACLYNVSYWYALDQKYDFTKAFTPKCEELGAEGVTMPSQIDLSFTYSATTDPIASIGICYVKQSGTGGATATDPTVNSSKVDMTNKYAQHALDVRKLSLKFNVRTLNPFTSTRCGAFDVPERTYENYLFRPYVTRIGTPSAPATYSDQYKVRGYIVGQSGTVYYGAVATVSILKDSADVCGVSNVK